MAIASCSVSTISRGNPKRKSSCVAAAAYQSGEKLYNEREQQGYHYAQNGTSPIQKS